MNQRQVKVAVLGSTTRSEHISPNSSSSTSDGCRTIGSESVSPTAQTKVFQRCLIDKGIRASEGSRGKLNIEQAGIHVFSQTNLGEDEMHHRSLTENDRFGFFLMLAGTVPPTPTPLSLLSTAECFRFFDEPATVCEELMSVSISMRVVVR